MTTKEKKLVVIGRILENKTFMPNSGVMTDLRGALLWLSLVQLENLELILSIKKEG